MYVCLVKKEGVLPENINIMSQYNAQCSKIKDRLKKHHVQHVNTVVGSQGNTFFIIQYSLDVLEVRFEQCELNTTSTCDPRINARFQMIFSKSVIFRDDCNALYCGTILHIFSLSTST